MTFETARGLLLALATISITLHAFNSFRKMRRLSYRRLRALRQPHARRAATSIMTLAAAVIFPAEPAYALSEAYKALTAPQEAPAACLPRGMLRPIATVTR